LLSQPKTLLAPSKLFWKPQNTAGTVPALFAPFKMSSKRPNAANTGYRQFTAQQLPGWVMFNIFPVSDKKGRGNHCPGPSFCVVSGHYIAGISVIRTAFQLPFSL
jgi:hypothetical protein